MPTAQTISNPILGHYQILREAGRGGMSMVYEAEDTRIGRRVALKVLAAPLFLAPEERVAMIARLKREARAIACLSHPNIVTIFDIGEDNGQHFIVMEFLSGLTLRERIAEGPLPLAETSAILDGVAAGLDAVHAAGIIHRDIKPSNVMLLPGGGVKLMDFGVARGYEDTLVTQAGTIVGSPTYMAPEQTQGEECSPATDLWSLGVTLYEMLAGHPPFAGENVPHILYQVAREKAPALPLATPALREVLGRALEKRPARRYSSARALADAFRAALPILAAARPIAPAPALRVAAAPPRIRPASARRPFFWGAGLLLLALAAALPQAWHHAPAPPRQVSSVSSTGVRPTAASHHAPPRSAVKSTLPTVTPQSAPVVWVASWHQTRTYRHSKHLPRRVAPAVPRRGARADLLAPRVRRRTGRSRPAGEHTRAVVPAARRAPVTLPSLARTPSGAGPSLLGTWRGTLTNHRATLVIDRHEGSRFSGTMSVHTGGRDARVAVSGHISPGAGRISMRETSRLPGTAANAWDLGTESGRLGTDGRIAGTGSDVKGHFGAWTFSR